MAPPKAYCSAGTRMGGSRESVCPLARRLIVADWTWNRARDAAAGAGWKRTRRGERRGRCQCGGERDRAWIRGGRGGAVLAGCNAGCSGVDVLRWLFGEAPAAPAMIGGRLAPEPFGESAARNAGPVARRNDGPRVRPLRRPAAPKPLAAPPGVHAKPDRAAALWAESLPVPLDPAHPARLWAARRHLWRPLDPWPDALRWLEDGGGSLVAAFAPVPDWIEAHPPASPPGVQLVHVAADGSPRTDAGGLGKRSHGCMSGAVAVIGCPLDTAPAVHVAEGIADALAIAARASGTALAVGGTSGFSKLAPALAALAVPVIAWPDGDAPGRNAAAGLVAKLRDRGAVARLATVPEGTDPAAMGGPLHPLDGR